MAKALTGAGFKATPVPSTITGYSTIQDDPRSDSNVRSAGWCSDWPSGATWLPPLYASTHADKTHSLGVNDSVFSNASVDKQLDAIQKMPLDQQPAAWNALDKQVMQKYFPLFPTYYGGVAMAHGSRIMGDNDDVNNGQPTWMTIWVKP